MTTIWTPHVTVATMIEHAGKFLCVQEQTRHGLQLNQPAGHLEPGETPATGAVREVFEETGLTVQLSHFLGVYLAQSAGKEANTITTYVRLAFVAYPPATADLPDVTLDDGIIARVWLTPTELRARCDEHRSPLVLECVEDYLRGRRLPLDTVFSHVSLLAGTP